MSDAPTPSSRSPDPRADALAVVRRLRDAGHVAYFAGGCVRDALLGLPPKDYDVATDAPPARVRDLFPRTQAVGAAFGVILVRQGRSQVEVATFRSDGRYVDGRRPEGVTFTTAEEDAKRRDFTINGLFYDPVDDRVIDFVGGQADLHARVLRTIGNPDERFEEDHLRLLRGVRFAARFGLAIEERTAAAVRAHAGQLRRISPERIADELRRMLTAPTRASAWRSLWQLGLVHELMRFMPPSVPAAAAAFDESRSLLAALAPGRETSFGAALAAAVLCYRWQASHAGEYPFDLLGLDLPATAGRAMRQALRVSNEELDELTGTLRDLRSVLNERRDGVASLKRFLAGPTAGPARELMRAMETIPGYDWRVVSRVRVALDRLAREEFAPTPLITGDDLTAAGLQPGRVFKQVLDAVYDAQLEGRVSGKREALELGLRIARGEG